MKKHQFRLLVIEDDADLRDYVVDNLRQSYEVFEAADGKEGWEKVFSCNPNLVISDIKLPLIDGIQLTKKIKSDKRTQHLPVILLTALNREEDQIKGLNSGANDYLIVAQVEADIKSSGDRFLAMAVSYIETNIKSPKLSVSDLSAHLGRSRVALYNRILELTGRPPVEFIRSYKLEKAADLLIKSDIAVSQIATETGFATAHYFSKSFKDKFGVLPSEYRTANLRSANS